MLNNIGNSYIKLKNNLEALKYLNQAVAVLKDALPFGGHPCNIVITHNILNICGQICDAGNANSGMEQHLAALECFLVVANSMKAAFPKRS